MFSCSRAFRSLDSNQLTGTIPPEFGNLTLLTSLYAIRMELFPLTIFLSSMIYMVLISLFIDACSHSSIVSLRDHSANKLTSTIPLQLGNLTQLDRLYSQRIRSLNKYRPIVHVTLNSFAFSGPSTGISSLAPSRLSLATSRSSIFCTQRTESYHSHWPYLLFLDCIMNTSYRGFGTSIHFPQSCWWASLFRGHWRERRTGFWL